MELLGVRVPGPVSAVKGLAGAVLSPLSRPRRRVWSCPGRLHIEAHGVHGPGGEAVAQRIEQAVQRHPGVAWARVNAPSSRVIIGVEDPAPDSDELIRVVEEAEGAPNGVGEEIKEDELHHPADGLRGTRLLPTLAADTLGLGLSLITRLAPWAPIPTEIAALPSVVDLHPRLRKIAAERAGSSEKADTATSAFGAFAQGLASGGEGTVVDIVQRAEQWREARAHERLWCQAESRLIHGPEDAAAGPVVVERPREIPDGPVEQYEQRILNLGAAAAAVSLPFVRPRRAIGIGLAALPKAAEAGRTAFGARLGRVLATEGVLVMDRGVLRHLDAIDTLVLDEQAFDTGRMVLNDLVPVGDGDGDTSELVERAWQLFDAHTPGKVHEDDGWRVGPLDELGVDQGAHEREQLEKRGAAAVLGLVRDQRLTAVIGLGRQVPPGVAAVIAAARRANIEVVSANGGHAAFEADRLMPGGERLVSTVRELQGDGQVVMLVSDDRRALGAADCGIGTQRPGDPPPWGAHLLIGEDIGIAALVVDAIAAAREVNRDSIWLSQGATGVGAVSALQPGRRSPANRAMRAVNLGAAVALTNAHRRAKKLAERDTSLAGDAAPWHLMPVDVVLDRLGTDPDGLSDDAAQKRARARGTGGGGRTSLMQAFINELSNPLTPVLIGGAALSASVGSPVDAALVAGITGVSALVGSVQQVHTEKQLAELLSRSAISTTVIRDGRERVVSADDLVPGDVVKLTSGDVVPADCRLLEADGVEADESSLTGESLPAAKDPSPVIAADVAERASMLYEGTTIAAGEAIGIVVATGADTEAGRSMAMARENAPVTGVETRLAELTSKSMPLAIGSAVAVAGAGLLRRVPLRESLSAAVNLAVASVPEGLPFLVSAAQLAAARRLAEHNALVRNPRSIEALGRVDVLCFDKTGTLTEGTLTVHEVDDGHQRRKIEDLDDETESVLLTALRATPQADDPSDLPHATDRAIVEGARRVSVHTDGWELVDAVPFEPSRGYHASLMRNGDGLVLSVKGAPESVLPRCDLDEGRRKKLAGRMKKLAKAGQRVLAVAESTPDNATLDEDSVTRLRFKGFVAIADPVRGSAAAAAADLRAAGVQIVMITGDHPDTGEAIAGKVSEDGADLHVVTGAELDAMDDDQLASTLETVDVVARCSPAQKVRIIKAYQKHGHTVAMTGDGANDAPAIRLADVGIALGGHGAPAARAAADLVVTDDRLETIIAALVEGRAMWASVREALAILLGGNLGEIGFSVLGATLTGRSPLGARQFLLVNLLTDLAPALAIALRRPEEGSDLLREGPESSLGKRLQKDIGVRAGVTTLGATTAWMLARATGRGRRASTVALAGLVGTQLGQTLLTGGWNRSVLATSLGSVALLAAVIQTPGVSQFFGCTPLGPIGWGMALGSAGAATALGAVVGRTIEG
ncbi:cation-translocating P-type ATPase [Amycolatopsis thermoflava]|uniref:Calcium-translocating P-type ATPase n=1 Tax=Amycolatopsis thermoflava TaxID=84480 RepID=A0A3N2H044_9PSEU|nr:cation-transporting P-type ATPase [Amycolatopsis thermoflava]ROS42272.1 calcium-translocating P-type ATPase [Amycolatopsis thermoflava]